MDPSKKPLGYRTGKYFFKHFVGRISRTEAIPMAHQDFFSFHLNFYRMGVHGDPELLREIISHPEVVVASEKKYGYPSITKLGELR